MGRMGLRLLVALGLFVCILTGWFTAHTARALFNAPAAPLSTSVAEAPDRRWVTLQDAVVDCSVKLIRQRTTLALANDRQGAHPFVAHLAGANCAAAARGQIDGAFVGVFSRVFLRARQHFDLPPGDDLRVFSQFEAPRYLRRALGWRLTWFGLSLLLTMLGVRALWASEQVGAAPAARSA